MCIRQCIVHLYRRIHFKLVLAVWDGKKTCLKLLKLLQLFKSLKSSWHTSPLRLVERKLNHKNWHRIMRLVKPWTWWQPWFQKPEVLRTQPAWHRLINSGRSACIQQVDASWSCFRELFTAASGSECNKQVSTFGHGLRSRYQTFVQLQQLTLDHLQICSWWNRKLAGACVSNNPCAWMISAEPGSKLTMQAERWQPLYHHMWRSWLPPSACFLVMRQEIREFEEFCD